MPAFPLLAPVLALLQAAPSDSARLYEGIERGRHSVGYRVVDLVDRSRHDMSPRRPGREVAPRRIRVRLWYPSIPARTRTLHFSQLVAETDSALVAHATELGGAAGVVSAGFARLGRIPTWSRRDTPALEGRHPLVLIPSHLAPGTVSIMAEYLSSRGYVVAAVPLSGTDSEAPEISLRGLETQAMDLQFATNELARLSFVDAGRLAVMGTGINASAGLVFAMRSDRVGALISLEGGITTPFELRMIRGTTTFDARRLRTPMLVVTAPHPDVDASRLDIYRNAPQHRLHLEGTGEFWVLNFGAMESIVPGVIGRAPGDVRTAYLTTLRFVERFLAAYLRHDESARQFLAAPPADARSAGSFRYVSRPAAPPALTRDQLLNVLVSEGASSVDRRIRDERTRDPDPVTAADFAALDGALARRGEAAIDDRLTLARLRAELFASSARAQLGLARLHLARRDSASAAAPAARAAELLAADGDPVLDSELRGQVLDLARRLQALRRQD